MTTAPQDHRRGGVEICLVSMPYTDLERPSLGLSLLAARLRSAGRTVRVLYPCIDLAEAIGPVDYYRLTRLPLESRVCDWTFTSALFPGQEIPGADDYVLEATRPRHVQPEAWREIGGEVLRSVRSIRDAAPGFVDRIARRIVELGPRIVGCTSVFQQHCASLALLKRVRELDPSVVTLIGGANCEGPMGVATRRSFGWVDLVVSGEADDLVVPLCDAIFERGRDLPADELPPGVIGAEAESLPPGTDIPRASVFDLDRLPTPDYGDYFAALDASPLGRYVDPGVLAESARGCWWGAKSHCTFCGLNGTSMTFRSKSPERVLDELEELAARHETTRFEMVDNILDNRYFDTLLPRLAERDPAFEFFFEVKANLKRRQLEDLAAAGVRMIQPGIESLHDGVLELLAKGNKGWMNVQLLKWAMEAGVHVTWIWLYGVPGEREEWYEEVLEWLPLVSHLQPPDHATPVQWHRFSPYHSEPDRWGLDLAPARGYSFVYPLDEPELRDLAYLFDDPADRTSAPVFERLTEAVDRWRDAFWGPSRPELTYTGDGAVSLVRDTRPGRAFDLHALGGVDAAVLRCCDGALPEATLVERVCSERPGAGAAAVEASLAELRARRLVLDLGGRVLALPVPADRAAEPGRFVGGTFDLECYLRETGRRRSAE